MLSFFILFVELTACTCSLVLACQIKSFCTFLASLERGLESHNVSQYITNNCYSTLYFEIIQNNSLYYCYVKFNLLDLIKNNLILKTRSPTNYYLLNFNISSIIY